MSIEEAKFIRQLKITLIVILGPFIITMAISMIRDHYAIKNCKNHIAVIEETYVSQDILLLYLNELRESNRLLRERVESNEVDFADQIIKLDKHMDNIIKEVYSFKSRGGRSPDTLSYNK